MNYAGISHQDVLNGEGVRVVLWVSGCSHNCSGCHNPETWDCNYGSSFNDSAKKEIFEELEKSWSDGITLSGGDPLHENNIDEIYKLLKEIKEKFPEKTIWLYTGYLYENLLKDKRRKPILDLCDVLIDGPFVQNLRDISIKWRGSSNQRVIDLNKSNSEKIFLFCS